MRLILRKLRILISGLMIFGLTACGASKHFIQSGGAKGIVKEETPSIKTFMPDKDGNLVEGETKLPAGTLFMVPKGEQELNAMLDAAGVKRIPAK